MMTVGKASAWALLAGSFALYAASPMQGQPEQRDGVIHVPLVRNENVAPAVGAYATFDPAAVNAALQKVRVRTPVPLPPGSKVGVLNGDDVFMILHRPPGRSTVLLTVDANMNRDLTDDPQLELKEPADPEEARTVSVRIRRSYPELSPSEGWLPYSVRYSSSRNANGEAEDDVGFFPAYRMDGTFVCDGTEYGIELSDYNLRGYFDKSNLSRGTVIRLYRRDDPENGVRFWGHELLPVGERLYEVADQALNGAWIELSRSALPQAMIGRATLDFDLVDEAGDRIRNRDYRGRYLLLDFWPSWCRPCVNEFPNIKKTIALYSKSPLSVVGINLDSEKDLDTARKIISDHQLPWKQVLPGKGYFLPLYQVFGRLPERPGSFPLYVMIGPDGVVQYATNSFSLMERFLRSRLGEPADPASIFVPMTAGRFMLGTPKPVMFSDDRSLHASLTLPRDLAAGAKVARLVNGMVVLAQAGQAADTMLVRVAGNGDTDLTDNDGKNVPILNTMPAEVAQATRFPVTLSYATGGQTFMPFHFFARRRADGTPELFYWGSSRPATGSFAVGDVEYRLEISDPSSDLYYSDDDVRTTGSMTVKQKRSGEWVTLHSGSEGIPIGGQLFRVRRVEEQGSVVELTASSKDR